MFYYIFYLLVFLMAALVGKDKLALATFENYTCKICYPRGALKDEVESL